MGFKKVARKQFLDTATIFSGNKYGLGQGISQLPTISSGNIMSEDYFF